MIGSAIEARPSHSLSNAATRCLETMALLVAEYNDLAGQSDKATVASYFATLLDAEPSVDRDAIRVFLVARRGWNGETADRAMEIFDKVRSGRRVLGMKPPDREAFRRWAAETD